MTQLADDLRAENCMMELPDDALRIVMRGQEQITQHEQESVASWSEWRSRRSFDVEEGSWFETTLLSARAGKHTASRSAFKLASGA
jgi:hypothetical protein